GVAHVPGTVELWSVGNYNANFHWQTLIEHWDGTSWQVIDSPNHPSANHFLYGVAAVALNDVWSVGRYEPDTGGTSTLILHWDGTNWSTVSSPNPATYSGLYAVAAVSAADVWAVGYYYSNGGQFTLTEHWDGTSWQVVPSPGLSSSLTALTAVSSLSPTDVWAVGTYYGPGAQLTLAQHWNGIGWQVVFTPNPAGEIEGAVNEFNSV